MRRKGVIGRGMRVLLLGTLGLAACATMAPEPTLYERFGAVDGVGIPRKGRDAISVVVDRFVANMVADARVNARFKRMAPPAVEKLGISEAEWSATVENLGKALDQAKVGEREKKELLAALGPMKGEIVGQ